MAITGGDRQLWRKLRAHGEIPERPVVLELGRANWYGDIPQGEAVEDWRYFADPGIGLPKRVNHWQAADWYYDVMLRRPTRVAIDLDPAAPDCVRHNLNELVPECLHGADVVINTGTLEHVFDQRAVWQSCHDACKLGGLMVHALPLWGWLDHGFTNFNPTLVADLASENGYAVLCWLIYEIKTGWYAPIECPADVAQHQARAAEHSAMMHVAFRKVSGEPFKVPMQGVYSRRATTEQLEAWNANR